MRLKYVGENIIVAGLVCTFAAQALCGSNAPEKWRKFASRGGWAVDYPATWQMGSCNNCKDIADPDVYVFFYDPRTHGSVRITPLKDKPAGEDTKEWLEHVKEAAVLNPRIREEWISLAGAPALRVMTRNPDLTEAENIYAANGNKTVFIQAWPVGDTRFFQQYLHMLSTFRFTGH